MTSRGTRGLFITLEGIDGAGKSTHAAWLAQTQLRQSGNDTALMAEMGFVGYQPRPADPFIFNSQLRFLLGYEWEAVRNFNVGLQYYLEHIRDHDRLIENSPFPEFEPPENRHVLTTRLTYRAMQDKLTWSFFAFIHNNES